MNATLDRTFADGSIMTFYLTFTAYAGLGPGEFVVDDWREVGVRVIAREHLLVAPHERAHAAVAKVGGVGHEHDVEGRLPLPFRPVAVFTQPPKDVFDVDHGVVDERADGDRHAAERHRVDRDAEQLQREYGRHERERNREH